MLYKNQKQSEDIIRSNNFLIESHLKELKILLKELNTLSYFSEIA
jgi:hypothetical protein